MTEAEWLTCDGPTRQLAHLNRRPGDRKLLLYAVACCSAHRDRLSHHASRGAVEWAERFADGAARRDDEYARLEWASEGAAFACEAATARADIDAAFGHEETSVYGEGGVSSADLRHLRGRIVSRDHLAVAAACFANALMTLDQHDPFDPTLRGYAPLLLISLLRDIFGNPFHSVAFSPEWRTDTALTLAKQLYESREFSAMPILADALQDAGCNEPAILDHCRDTSLTHVRGCWVTDLVLGKS